MNSSVEFCSIKDKEVGEAFMTYVLSLIDKGSPGFLHDCPYVPADQVGVKNFVIDQDLYPLIGSAGFNDAEIIFELNFIDKNEYVGFWTKIYIKIQGIKIKKKNRIYSFQ